MNGLEYVKSPRHMTLDELRKSIRSNELVSMDDIETLITIAECRGAANTNAGRIVI